MYPRIPGSALTAPTPEAIMRPLARIGLHMSASPAKRPVDKVELVQSSGTPLAVMFEIEATEAWPSRMDEYTRAMRYMAAQLRGPDPEREAARSEIQALLNGELGGLLLSRDEDERGARRDAFNEMVADTWGLAEALEMAASKLSEEKPPNLISFLRAKLIWKANDILESEIRRHQRRVRPVPDPHVLRPPEQRTIPGARRTQRRVLVHQIMLTFGDGDPVNEAILTGLMEGESIAELARKTGRSRQQIYRFLQRIRGWIERKDE